ncbi:cupin domain-containing protein [Amycolatopsis pigmentata]|uniref:Cupin domain-containing protein n=1 Tax=Amycolatopsis pigmentata TaxID=450801 RepID=A0ABW5G3K2_9PSEU
MKHVRPADRVGTARKTGSQFTGTVNSFLTLSADGVIVNTVDFTPGARTFWHTHEHGQILQVLAGQGRVGTAEGVRVLRPGDTVWCPPGERHWHGAGAESFMTHTAISLGVTSWAEEVDDATYTTEADGESGDE